MKIVVLNQKGGVGKSTVSVNLAYGLATIADKKTLLVDLDPQAHSTVIFCPDIQKENHVGNLLLEKKAKIRQVIRPAVTGEAEQVVGNLFLIPANIHLALIAEQVTTRMYREKLLHNHLKKVEKEYDFILIDCPPAVNVLTINAIYTADLVLIPTTYGRYSLDGIADLFQSIADVKESDDFPYLILRNGYDARTKVSNEYVEGELAAFSDHLLQTVIRRIEAINQAQMNNEPVFLFDPRSNGSRDFKTLTREIVAYGS